MMQATEWAKPSSTVQWGGCARAQALEPVGHVLERQVVDAHRRQLGLARQQHVLRGALGVDVGVALVVALLLDELVARAALAADVHERRLLAHVAREAGRVVAEARRVAHEEALRVLEQGLEGVGVLAPVVPGEDAAVRHHRAREAVAHEPVHEVDAVAHPLVGDAAREVLVEAELEVEAGIEGPVRLGHEPLAPVGVLLADLRDLLAPAPARAVVVPLDLDLAHLAEGAAPHELARRARVGLAAVLGADLDDALAARAPPRARP